MTAEQRDRATLAARAQQAYFDAVAQHIDNGERWEIVARAVVDAYKEQTSQVETDLTVSVEEMALRRYNRGREIYGGEPAKVDWLAEMYPELVDAYAMDRYGRKRNGFLGKLIKDVAEWVRVELLGRTQ